MPREFIGNVPARVAALPRDVRGYPIPKFVAWIDGEPDFRVADVGHKVACTRRKICWICGQPLGVFKCFVAGPMCGVNRVSSEPPSHLECGRFAALNCPFLSHPLAKRPDLSDLLDKVGVVNQPPGFHIPRNPGVTLVWITRIYRPFQAQAGAAGLLYEFGDPETIEFYFNGRKATRAEIDDSVHGGLPSLRELAAREGAVAIRELEGQRARFEHLLEVFA